MKILILADSAAPHTRRWAMWFARNQHEVHVASFNSRGLPGYDAIQVHTLWKHRLGNRLVERVVKAPIIWLHLRSLINRVKPDVIHAHSAGGYAWMAWASGFRPYIVTPWGTDILIDIVKSSLNRAATKIALGSAAVVTTDGFHFVDALARLGVESNRIVVHMFGTDTVRYAPGSDDNERKRLGIAANPIVISTRTPNPVHSVETFIRAIPIVVTRFPEARFVQVGDGAQRKELERLAADLGVGSVIHFTGMVDEERMRGLLRASDVYVSTSVMDAGLAASTAEAMSTGLPVIQANNSDNAKWAPDGFGGFLFPDGNHLALADKICQLLGDADMRAAMGAVNRQRIVADNNVDIEMGKIASIYEAASKQGI